ncbi:MAG: hypothetical protein HC831_30865 [Chloroflexia bacterium]|nr:hypothetical protein [Chloroflexia bacterium]
MKKIILYLVAVTAVFIPKGLMAQDCDFYFPDKEGTKVETTNYDKKGKETGTSAITILENKKTSEGQLVKVASEFKGASSDSVYKQEYTVECKNGEFYINMDSYLDQNSMQAYKNMEVEVETEQMILPSNLKAGQILNNGRVTAIVKNNGIKIFTLNTSITDRKVDGFEQVTTPAGTFDCVKISYTIEIKVMLKVTMTGIQWFAKNIGAVKTETYNKKGKLESSSMITKIEN